jgi:hypothetical protein
MGFVEKNTIEPIQPVSVGLVIEFDDHYNVCNRCHSISYSESFSNGINSEASSSKSESSSIQENNVVNNIGFHNSDIYTKIINFNNSNKISITEPIHTVDSLNIEINNQKQIIISNDEDDDNINILTLINRNKNKKKRLIISDNEDNNSINHEISFKPITKKRKTNVLKEVIVRPKINLNDDNALLNWLSETSVELIYQDNFGYTSKQYNPQYKSIKIENKYYRWNKCIIERKYNKLIDTYEPIEDFKSKIIFQYKYFKSTMSEHCTNNKYTKNRNISSSEKL